MHGYCIDESSIDSMCSMHQDWCSKETIVMAFSLHQNGYRVMVQVTMRMKENNVAKAVELLQTKVFGKAIEAQETIQRDVKMSEQKQKTSTTGSKRKSENALDRDVLISGVGAGNYDGTMTLAGTTSIWVVYEDGLTYITKEKPYF